MTAPYTLSASYRAQKCTASLALLGAEAETEGQAAGTVRHKYIAAVASAGGAVGKALSEVPAEHRQACAELDMEALEPFFRPGQWAHNVSVAWHPESGAAVILGIGLTREEKARKAEEWASARGHQSITHGEADVVGLAADAVVVPDFKPPWGSAEHAEAWRAQVEGLAAALAAAFGRERAVCAYLQLRPGARPVSWELDAVDLDVVRARHAEVLRVHRAGRGTYAIGPWCSYCPALRVCPQQVAALVSLGTLAPPVQDLRARAEAAAKELATAQDSVVEAAFVTLKQFRGDNGLPEVMWRALRARVSAHPVRCADGDVIGIRDVVDEVDWEIAASVLNALGFSQEVVCASLTTPEAAEEQADSLIRQVLQIAPLAWTGHMVKQLQALIWRQHEPACTKASVRSAVQATMAPRARGNGAIHARVEEALAAAGAFKYHGKIAKFTPEST